MMKKLIYFLAVGLFISCATAQKTETTINQKLDSKSGKEIVLTKVEGDSRCPKGTECIWAGEVIFEVSVYENGKIIEEKKFNLSPSNQEEVTNWFKNHLTENLKEINILPQPKQGVAIKTEDYYIELVY